MASLACAHDVLAAAEHTVKALERGVDLDWSVPAGELRWSCRRTAIHIADCLIAYAAQIAAEPADHWVSFKLSAPRTASPPELLELINASAGIVAAAVTAASPRVRAYHPFGTSDPPGFAAMAVTELLIHGSDIAAGLSIPFDGRSDLSRRALARLFPSAGDHDDAWALLRWATGREALDDRPRRRSWRWHGEPVS